MKKKMRMTSVLAAAVLAASALLSGCSGNTETTEESTAQTAETQAEESQASAETAEESAGAAAETAVHDESRRIADGDVTLTIFCDFQNGARAYYTDLGDNPVVQWIEEDTGLNLEFIHAPAGDDGSYFQQLLASGDLPDLMFTNLFQSNYPGGVEGAIADGLLYNVTELVET